MNVNNIKNPTVRTAVINAIHNGRIRVARNYRFKAGDKVKYIGRGGDGKVYEIVSVDPAIRGRYASYELGNQGPHYGDFVEEEDLVAANADFKVGESVKFWVFDKKATGKVFSVGPNNIEVKADKNGEIVSFPKKDLAYWNAAPVANSEARQIVANALEWCGKGITVSNAKQVEISLRYASRAQSAMRDATRTVSGVRISSTNTLECPDEDSANEVIDILKRNAGIPNGEVWTNATPDVSEEEHHAYVKQMLDALIHHKTPAARISRVWSSVSKVHPQYRNYAEGKEIERILKENHLLNSTVATNGDWDNLATIYIDRAIEAKKQGNAHEAARYKEKANELMKIMRRADTSDCHVFNIRVDENGKAIEDAPAVNATAATRTFAECIDAELVSDGSSANKAEARQWLEMHRDDLMVRYGRDAYLEALDRWSKQPDIL